MAKQYTFNKRERLTNVIQIEHLFNSGSTFTNKPFKIFFQFSDIPQSYPVTILIAVSTKKFKRAVDRNRIRRKIKEAYRLNKNILINEVNKLKLNINLGIVYISNDYNPDYHILENKLVECLIRLGKMIGS